jgi:hypothetical protein
MFSEPQIKELSAPLNRANVRKNPKGFDYVEAGTRLRKPTASSASATGIARRSKCANLASPNRSGLTGAWPITAASASWSALATR